MTKVRPPKRRGDLATRQRLNSFIGDNLDRKLLLVSAPAGYGKTSLLVDYAECSGHPMCWYRLDDGDRDPMVFLEHLVAALRQRFPGSCQATLEMLQHAESASLTPVDAIGSLVNDLSEDVTEFCQLVLDDFQHVDDADGVNEALDVLLAYLPANCQVVVSGRTVPRKLTLTRLAGAGQVAGIGQDQLRFTPGEVAELVASVHGRHLSQADSERLAARSEGWATALVLGHQALLEGRRDTAVDKPSLFDFLAQEVMARQPAGVREFLRRTAVLDELCPPLCDAVLDRSDSAAMLDWIESHNLFVSRTDSDQPWHRYHQLFRDFLQTRLQAEPAGVVAGLHARAAAWFGSAGRPEDEIRHLLAAGDFRRAAACIAAAAEDAHAHGRWQTIIGWAQALPRAELQAHPGLSLRLATALAYVGEPEQSLQAYDWALGRFEAMGDTEGVAAVLARRAVLARHLGRPADAVEDARRALEMAADPTGTTAGLAHRALGGALAVQGNTAAAIEELRSALVCLDARGEKSMAATATSDLSAICQWSGDVDGAITHALQAHDRWRSLGNSAAMSICMNNLGSAYHMAGDMATARLWLERAVETGRRFGYRRASALANVSLGDVLADLDDFGGAIARYDTGIGLATAVKDSALTCYALASRAEAHRLAGDLATARRDLADARLELGRAGAAYEQALVAHVAGTIELDARDPAHAVAALLDAAAAFSSLGARREESRSLLYASTAAARAGDEFSAGALEQRARASIADLAYPRCMEPHLRRLGVRASVAPTIALPGLVTAASRPGKGGSVASDRLAEARATLADRLTVRAFGTPMATVSGHPVDRREFQTSAAHELFFLLVDHPEGLSTESLKAAFWPDVPDLRARRCLQSTVHRVRHALARQHAVQLDVGRYILRWPGELLYDVADFTRLLQQAARARDDAVRARLLTQAVETAPGDFMEGLWSDWCVARRLALDGLLTQAWIDLGAARSRVGDASAAVSAFAAALTRDPLREEAHRGLMRTYAAMGNRALALRQFDTCARILSEELGAEPDPATRELRRQLVG